MNPNDERPVYDDLGYFHRGRSAYHADPHPPIFPAWFECALNAGIWLILPALFWGALLAEAFHLVTNHSYH